jgi:hypothetical protein
MAGWLGLMLILVVAGREATRELNVFQIMELRTGIAFFMLYPLIRINGGFATMTTSRPLQHIGRNLIHYGAQLGWFFALTLIPLGQWWRSNSPCRSGPPFLPRAFSASA